MKVWIPNNKNKLKKTLLGSVPTSKQLAKMLKRPIPKVIDKVLNETHEDLLQIKETFETLGVEVLSYPVETMEKSLNVRDGFIVVDDCLYITEKKDYLAGFYSLIDNKVMVPVTGVYCPDIYIHDDYAILDYLDRRAYQYWRQVLSKKRNIITAFNEGHSDGIYCNVADKIWLTNGNALDFDRHWPGVPVMELSMTNNGNINDWSKVEAKWHKQELEQTDGRYLIYKEKLNDKDMQFINQYLKNWTGYAEETLFDLNFSIIDKNNVLAISQNSMIYDKLESLDIKIHKVPWRHRFFWDDGLHCITNDLVREY